MQDLLEKHMKKQWAEDELKTPCLVCKNMVVKDANDVDSIALVVCFVLLI